MNAIGYRTVEALPQHAFKFAISPGHFAHIKSLFYATVAMLALTNVASAANSAWATSTGSWSVGTNWSPSGVPASNQDTTLSFGIISGSTTIGIDDISGTFTLNKLSYAVSSNNPLRITALAGDTLNFVTNSTGTLPSLNFSGSGTSGTGTFSVGFTATNALTINNTETTPILFSSTIINTGGITLAGTKGFTYSGVMSGVGSLTVTNTAGTWTFSKANTYSGDTLVSSGTLNLSNSLAIQNSAFDTSGAGIVTITPATLTLGGLKGSTNLNSVMTTGTLTALTLNPGAGVTDTYSGGIADGASGMTLTKSGLGMQILSGTNTYTGITTVSAGTLEFANLSALNFGASTTATQLTTASGATTAFGVGTGGFTSAQINSLSTSLITNATATTGFKNGSFIGFDTTGADFTYGTAITNATSTGTNVLGLTKLGSNALILTGTNTYTGATTVTAGTLIVNGSLASGSTVTVGTNTAVATLAGNGTISGSIVTATTGGNVAHVAPGATAGTVGTLHVGNLGFTIGNNTVFDYDLTNVTTVGGAANDLISMTGGALTIGGTATFNFNNSLVTTTGSYTLLTGAGSVAGFSAANFYATNTGSLTATFSADATSIYVTFSGAAPPSATAAYFNGLGSSMNTAGNFDSTVSGTVVNTGGLGAATNVSFSANRNTATSATVNSALTVNSLNFGVGSGTNSGITISGTSALTITGSAVNGNTAGSGITTTGSGSDTISAPIVLGASQTWTVDTSGTLTVSGNVSGSGDMLTKAGAGTLILTGTSTYSGGTTILTGILQIGNGGSTGTIGTGAISNSGTLVFDLTTNYNLTNAISGNGTITDIGSGTLTLSGSNTSTGGTTITTGTLSVGSTSSLGSGLISLANGTSLQYTGGSATLAQNVTVTSGNGTVNNSGGATLTLSGTLTKADSNLILNAGGSTIDVTGRIVSTGASGAFDSDLYVTNGTVIADNSNNTYAGPTHIYGNGTLQNGFDNALPTSTIVELGNSGGSASETGASYTNTYALNGHNQSIAGLTTANPIGFTDVNRVIGGSATLSTLTLTGTGTGSLGEGTFGGTGTNANNLAVKFNASNTITLTGSNTYTGGTEIATGTLKVTNTSGSATGTGSLLLDSGATLSGNGTINSTNNTINGDVMVGSGGSNTTDVLTMTASGTTTFSNVSLTFNLSSTTLGQSNTLALGSTTSALFSTSSLTLNLLGGAVVPDTTEYVLFTSTTGGSGIGGSIFGGDLVLGAGNLITGLNFTINSAQPAGYYANSYLKLVANGGGFNIDVEVVPEPGTWALMFGGLVLLVAFQRVRRSKNS